VQSLLEQDDDSPAADMILIKANDGDDVENKNPITVDTNRELREPTFICLSMSNMVRS
jgi:hypothetical protein